MPRDLIASEVRDFDEEQNVSAEAVFEFPVDDEKYAAISREMIMLREQKAVIEKREAALKKELMEILERIGTPYGDSGQHRTIEFLEPIRGIARFVRQTKSTVTTDLFRAEAIARQKKIYNRLFKPVPTLDEGAVMVAREQGLLTDADVDEIFPRKVSYSFVVEKAK